MSYMNMNSGIFSIIHGAHMTCSKLIQNPLEEQHFAYVGNISQSPARTHKFQNITHNTSKFNINREDRPSLKIKNLLRKDRGIFQGSSKYRHEFFHGWPDCEGHIEFGVVVGNIEFGVQRVIFKYSKLQMQSAVPRFGFLALLDFGLFGRGEFSHFFKLVPSRE